MPWKKFWVKFEPPLNVDWNCMKGMIDSWISCDKVCTSYNEANKFLMYLKFNKMICTVSQGFSAFNTWGFLHFLIRMNNWFMGCQAILLKLLFIYNYKQIHKLLNNQLTKSAIFKKLDYSFASVLCSIMFNFCCMHLPMCDQ